MRRCDARRQIGEERRNVCAHPKARIGVTHARKILVEAIPEEPVYGHTPLAGLPKGFRAAA